MEDNDVRHVPKLISRLRRESCAERFFYHESAGIVESVDTNCLTMVGAPCGVAVRGWTGAREVTGSKPVPLLYWEFEVVVDLALSRVSSSNTVSFRVESKRNPLV